MAFDYDVLVIGGGSGGMAASKRATVYGKRAAIVEQADFGGTCANRGCIPKKLIVYAADVALTLKSAGAFGWESATPELQWSTLTQRIQSHVGSIQQSIASSLKEKGVTLLRGRAHLKDLHTVILEGDQPQEVTAETIILAVGGKPNRLDIPGAEHALVSSDMFTLKQRPQRFAVMGGGYIGVEFSSMLAALGSEVTVIEPSGLILSGFDHSLRQALQTALCDRGIQILPETVAKSIEKTGDGLVLSLKSDRGGLPDTLAVDQVLMAVGRHPNIESLGLEAAGVEVKEGAIAVDDYSQTTQENIYAVGDCTDRLPLTPAAIAEGKAVIDTLYGDEPVQVEYQWIPSAVFARPESATVGLTESEARKKFGDEGIKVFSTQFQPLKHQFTESGAPVLLKLIIDSVTKRVLGCHMMGEHAADTIQAAAIAIKDGITSDKIGATIGIHPTTAEELLDLI
ncbi:MAG: glutathione-disulfide reductase [Cyanobacteria bacterium P01_A01_bin.135]